jgi:hypothetical protein
MSQGNFGSPAAKDGVYAYVCLPPGSYGVGALVTGYADQSKSASLASGETKSLMFPMTKPSVEGDVEGGLPVEGPVVTEGDTSGETGAEGEDSPPTRRGCFG